MAIMAILGGIAAAIGLSSGLIYQHPAYVTRRAREVYSEHPTMLPDLSSLCLMRFRQQISVGQYTEWSREIGFAQPVSDGVYQASHQLLSGQDYTVLWRRGIIEESALTTKLRQLRFSENDIGNLKRVTEFYPQPQDLIRFAVREVYTPAAIEKFGMREDMPDEFIEAAGKGSVPPEQAENYWMAHWELPSPAQVFEMFQRDIIDKDTMMMGLKALDIMPFWRDKLTGIAYNTLTRVDIRRMHAMGVLDDQQTEDAYRHQGYSPENAELMLRFTQEYNSGDTKGITRASVLSSYKEGMITDAQLKEYLEMLGYSDSVVSYWMSVAEYEKTADEIEEVRSDLFLQYRLGLIDMSDLRVELGYHDLPATYIEAQIVKEERQPTKKIKVPSRTDLESWWKKGVISEEGFYKRVVAMGYLPKDVRNYIEEIEIEEGVPKRKYLSRTDYLRWYFNDMLTRDETESILKDMRISETDIGRLLMETEEKKSESIE